MTDRSTPDSRTPDSRTVRAGIADIEGYLLWQAETDRARADAEAFVDALDWPTTAQRQELVRLLALRQLDLSQRAVTRIAGRALQLRREYQQRYDCLKRRVLAAALAVLVALVLLNVLVLAAC
ncbi:hypothetical protein SAMN05428945_5930 [Streptomyces sp. 2224.1]|uniref:hypothetical protein n=1 Tax=Streptomyces sp. 2224.1 TaxID=1881020 RepID=UPI0008974A74|nr:hypothetical protein [Streptomyces sp. 2224.1]SED89156.1 hypothetical protein SAMN05428945_5930 [Streptomyces sp. 2224.1]